MLNFYEFCTLPSEEQSDFILDMGYYLCAIERNEYKVGLFYLFDFYVEIFFHYESGTIVKINPFRDLEKLTPYINDVDISDLYQ